MMLIGIKQHLSNIWSSIHEMLSNSEAELKKSVAYKKKRVSQKVHNSQFIDTKMSLQKFVIFAMIRGVPLT